MKTQPKLARPLLFGAVLLTACARHDPPAPAGSARAPGLATTTAPAPWEPVDKQFTGCAGS